MHVRSLSGSKSIKKRVRERKRKREREMGDLHTCIPVATTSTIPSFGLLALKYPVYQVINALC